MDALCLLDCRAKDHECNKKHPLCTACCAPHLLAMVAEGPVPPRKNHLKLVLCIASSYNIIPLDTCCFPTGDWKHNNYVILWPITNVQELWPYSLCHIRVTHISRDICSMPMRRVLALCGNFCNFPPMCGNKDPPFYFECGGIKRKNMLWKVFRWVGVGFWGLVRDWKD